MTNEATTKTSCTNCNTVYKLPRSFLDKIVTCKRCGTKFKATEGEARKTYPIVGKLALKSNLITQEQLEAALAFQAAHSSADSEIPLDKILFDKGFITDEQLQLLNLSEKYWHVSQLSKGFCTLAIQRNFITSSDAEAAFKTQAQAFSHDRSIRRVSDILIDAGIITEEQRKEILTAQGRTGSSPPVSTANSLQPAAIEIKQPPTPASNVSPESHPEAPQIPDSTGKFVLTVSEDRMSAVIRPEGGRLPDPTAAYVHTLLETEKVIYGIIPDKDIEVYLSKEAPEGKALTLATGTFPVDGQNATVIHHFVTEHKAGKLLDNGKIDYRDLGQIPHVKKGDLLAEKVPMVPGKVGIDVYGVQIDPSEPLDIPLREGTGTLLSEDGLKLFAEMDGQPKISISGQISVVLDLTINGDVDLKTGHVIFDGNIIVTGSIQSGFRVKGHNLSANEITAAEINVTGDIKVAGGIIGTVINCQGNISAKYISSAKISAYGNITVSKEITDSNIETSGNCTVGSGIIIASDISAKQGIEAKDIGTGVSAPCKLSAGVDTHIQQEIRGIDNAILACEEKRQELRAAFTGLDVDQQTLHQKITQLAQVQDRSQVEKRTAVNQLEKMRTSGIQEMIIQTEKRIKELDQKAKAAEEELSELFDRQDELEKRMEALESQLAELQIKKEEQLREKQALIDWSNTRKPVPVVSASGQICAGTLISGAYTKTLLRENCRHVRVQEVKTTNPDALVEWEIQIVPYK
jgi:uncharacterized protein